MGCHAMTVVWAANQALANPGTVPGLAHPEQEPTNPKAPAPTLPNRTSKRVSAQINGATRGVVREPFSRLSRRRLYRRIDIDTETRTKKKKRCRLVWARLS